jgi:hypothetical protein
MSMDELEITILHKLYQFGGQSKGIWRIFEQRIG